RHENKQDNYRHAQDDKSISFVLKKSSKAAFVRHRSWTPLQQLCCCRIRCKSSAQMLLVTWNREPQFFSSSTAHSARTNPGPSLQISQRRCMDAAGGRSLSSSLVTLKFERNVRRVVGHLKINAPINDPRRLSPRVDDVGDQGRLCCGSQ